MNLPDIKETSGTSRSERPDEVKVVDGVKGQTNVLFVQRVIDEHRKCFVHTTELLTRVDHIGYAV